MIVVEVFGRYAGHTAFRGGIAADADAILIPEIPIDFGILYEHAKKRYFRRIEQSDVHAGTYLIVVAEGLKNADGTELYDESAGVDAFGHKKLAGAGKYVCQELSRRFEEDSEIEGLMKKTKMFVPGIYKIPEVRSVQPGHLVRSGHASAYDVNFGIQAGAGAVLLLIEGISGVTVSNVEGKKIKYVKTRDAIKQRHVDLADVVLYENMGICFGREKTGLDVSFEELKGHVQRYM